MQHPVDLESLSQALTDHPWLADAIRNGAWWDRSEGGVELVAPLGDPHELRAGLAALTAALGIETIAPGTAAGWRSMPVAEEVAASARWSAAR